MWICCVGLLLLPVPVQYCTVCLVPSEGSISSALRSPPCTMPSTEVYGEQQYAGSSSHVPLGMEVNFMLINPSKILHTNQLLRLQSRVSEVKMFLLFAPGFINTLLSWSVFVPLSRLTYASYLVHLIVMYVFNSSRTRPFYMTDYAQVGVTLRSEHSC